MTKTKSSRQIGTSNIAALLFVLRRRLWKASVLIPVIMVCCFVDTAAVWGGAPTSEDLNGLPPSLQGDRSIPFSGILHLILAAAILYLGSMPIFFLAFTLKFLGRRNDVPNYLSRCFHVSTGASLFLVVVVGLVLFIFLALIDPPLLFFGVNKPPWFVTALSIGTGLAAIIYAILSEKFV